MAAEVLASAVPAAIEAAKWAYGNRENIKSGLNTGITLARKYGSKVRPLANTLMSVSGRKKTGKELMNKIRNPVKTAKEAASFITSGKASKLGHELLSDANKAISAAEDISGRDLSMHRKGLMDKASQVTHYHDILSKYAPKVTNMLT